MKLRAFVQVTVLLCVATAAQAAALDLNAVLYPEGKKIPLSFVTTDRAPKAKLAGNVTVQNNQAMITVEWSKLEPALLFGGDMNCWVLWAVTPDGLAANLGEVPVRENRSGKGNFATLHKNFAMMVTAEPSTVVNKPSEVVAFVSQPTTDKFAKNAAFKYSEFRSLYTARDHESIAELKYDDKIPVDLQQARKAIKLMDRVEAEKYAEPAARDARVALGQAEDAYAGRVGTKKDVPELSRRSTALVNEAVRAAVKEIDAQRLRDEEAARLSEFAALEAETEAERTARLETEAALADVERQRQQLEVDMGRLRSDRAQLQRERDALAQRLSNALGAVSNTVRTGRGLVVNLSGEILFDTGKSALKKDAELALAKLAGILLMIPDTKIMIEGHTDSTGSLQTNEKLSLERAASVREFLQSQGVGDGRMAAEGLGPSKPVDTNDTPEGRAKNRRVEIVVPESGS